MYHIFDIDMAKEYGICAAIILYNLYFWCKHNEANGAHFYDGLYWTFNSIKAFIELFPYMTDKQIRNAVQKLIAPKTNWSMPNWSLTSAVSTTAIWGRL